MTPDGEVSQQADGMILSNGLDWTTDNRTMLFADSLKPAVYAFDFDLEKGEISKVDLSKLMLCSLYRYIMLG